MRTTLIILFILNCVTVKSQDLSAHKWENRVLLVVSENESFDVLKAQILCFENKTEALIDRKLIIYKVLPKRYTLNNGDWIASTKLFKRFSTKNETFKVILIGLDGSIKLNENEVISAEKLFSRIDSMPMRKSEIKRN